jgi:hypothetical protein
LIPKRRHQGENWENFAGDSRASQDLDVVAGTKATADGGVNSGCVQQTRTCLTNGNKWIPNVSKGYQEGSKERS